MRLENQGRHDEPEIEERDKWKTWRDNDGTIAPIEIKPSVIPKKKGEQKREDCQALEEDKCLAVKGQTGGEFSAAEGQTSESQRGEKCLEEDESDEVQIGDKCSAVEGQTRGECSDVELEKS